MCVYDIFNSFWGLYVCFNYVSIITAHQAHLQRLIVSREQLIVISVINNNRNYKTFSIICIYYRYRVVKSNMFFSEK